MPRAARKFRLIKSAVIESRTDSYLRFNPRARVRRTIPPRRGSIENRSARNFPTIRATTRYPSPSTYTETIRRRVGAGIYRELSNWFSPNGRRSALIFLRVHPRARFAKLIDGSFVPLRVLISFRGARRTEDHEKRRARHWQSIGNYSTRPVPLRSYRNRPSPQNRLIKSFGHRKRSLPDKIVKKNAELTIPVSSTIDSDRSGVKSSFFFFFFFLSNEEETIISHREKELVNRRRVSKLRNDRSR